MQLFDGYLLLFCSNCPILLVNHVEVAPEVANQMPGVAFTTLVTPLAVPLPGTDNFIQATFLLMDEMPLSKTGNTQVPLWYWIWNCCCWFFKLGSVLVYLCRNHPLKHNIKVYFSTINRTKLVFWPTGWFKQNHFLTVEGSWKSRKTLQLHWFKPWWDLNPQPLNLSFSPTVRFTAETLVCSLSRKHKFPIFWWNLNMTKANKVQLFI